MPPGAMPPPCHEADDTGQSASLERCCTVCHKLGSGVQRMTGKQAGGTERASQVSMRRTDHRCDKGQKLCDLKLHVHYNVVKLNYILI